MKKLLIILLVLFTITGCHNTNKIEIKNDSGVVYEIFVQSFADSDGDGIGDINGIIEKLDYLYDLGIQQIWLTPINTSSSSHRYDVEDYFSIDPELGTMEDFENLITKAKEKNIGIIMDMVFNHSSNQCDWFRQSIEARLNHDSNNYYYNFYNYIDHFENNYHYIADDLYYEGVYYSDMPDLNLDDGNVRNEIYWVIRFYLEKGVAGFRLDSGAHFYNYDITKNNEFVSWLQDCAKDINPSCYIVSEVWQDYFTVLEYYKSNLTSFFDFDLSNDGLIYQSIVHHSGKELANIFLAHHDEIAQINPEAVNAIFLSNHDQNRYSELLDELHLKLAASVYLLSPFKPFIYYGEEIGMKGSGQDANKRLAMLWGEENECISPEGYDYDNHNDSNLKQQKSKKDALYHYYKQIIEIRNKNSFLLDCSCEVVDLNNDQLFALHCYNEEKDIIIIHNFSDERISFTKQKGYTLQSSLHRKNKVNTIEPYSSIVLEKK